MPPIINGRKTEHISIDCIGTPTYSNLEKFLDAYASAGLFEGGNITDSGSGQIDIAAAKGVIRTTDSEIGELVAFDIAATVDVSLTDNTMNYIYIDYNSGTPTYAVTTNYDSINLHSQVLVGRVYRLNTVLYISDVGQDIQDATLRDLYRIQSVRRMERSSGAILGFVSATRQPTVTAGVFFSNYDRIDTAAFDASGTDRFVTWYRNGSGGWSYTSAQQNIDNVNYDDGSGTLVALGGGNYGVHWVYELVDGAIHIQYGQENSGTLTAARATTVPSAQPPPVVGLGILIGRIIIQKNATTIYETASAFDIVFTGTTASNHNDLANIQGGTSGEYYHLTSAQQTAVGTIGDKIAKATNVTAINDTGIADGEIAVFNLSNKDIRTSDKTIVTTLGSDDTSVPTSKAVKDVTDGAILKSLVDAKGDLLVGTAADTVARLAIGATDGHVLTIDAAETSGMKWAAGGGGGSSGYAIRRYIEGELYTTTLMYHRVNAAATITEARATVGSIPVGANLLVDVRKLDSTGSTNVSTQSIFTSDTPITIATGSSLTYGVYSATGTLDTGNDRDDCAAGDVLLVVITQVGSTYPASDLEVIISLTPT